MWKRPWGLGEGFCICAGLVIMGLLLQVCTGGVDWQNLAYPLNVYLLSAYLIILCLSYSLHQRIYFIRWAMGYKAALPSLIFTVGLTFLMGMITQVPGHIAPTDAIGLSKMLSFWPFVLIYWWMTSIVGWVSLKHLCAFRWKEIPFLCNHLGLFIALTSATLGSADMQRLSMNVRIGQTEWRATDNQGQLHEPPLAIELTDFRIDEYPPKLMLIDNETGKALPENAPCHLSIEDSTTCGELNGWKVEVLKKMNKAASVASADSVNYVEWHNVGATYAAYVRVTSPDATLTKEGWISCGSFLFPYQALRLDESCSMVMPDREPKKFVSSVIIYTKKGETMQTDIEVNKPAKINGWKIYQLSYDESKGRWSDLSVFELVSDPWLPIVYAGIGLMIAGALWMFITAYKYQRRANE